MAKTYDELDSRLREWLRQLCTCRSVSNGIHGVGCAVSYVTDVDLLDLSDAIWDWHEDEMGEVVDATPTEIPVVSAEDPEAPV